MRKEALRVGGTGSPTIRAAHLGPFAIAQQRKAHADTFWVLTLKWLWNRRGGRSRYT
jgi:hypothetical protein